MEIPPDLPRDRAALTALFARTSRNAETIVFPINEAVGDTSLRGPAFYCVHSLSGAGGTDFQHLAALLPEVRFYGIQAPRTRMSEQAFGRSVETIAGYYAEALMRFQPSGRFLLGGWSAGAIIGLEIAQQLRARGRDVGLFVAMDAAPENSSAAYRGWHPVYLLEVIGNVAGWLRGEELGRAGAALALAGRAGKKLLARFGRGSSSPAERCIANGLLVEGFMDLSRYPADQQAFMKRLYNALLEYTPKPYAGAVVAYEARIRPLLRLPQVGRVWRRIAPAATVVDVPGTHLSILRASNVRPLAADLRMRIARADSSIADPGLRAGASGAIAAGEQRVAPHRAERGGSRKQGPSKASPAKGQ